MDERLRFVIDLQNKASAEIRRLSRDMGGVKPHAGMTATTNWFSQLESVSNRTSKTLAPLSEGLSTIGAGGLAAGLSIAGLVSQFRDLARSLPAMQELSRQSGLTKTQIAQLQYAASKLHIDPSKMTSALSKFSEEMVRFQLRSGDVYKEMARGSAGLADKIADEWKNNPMQALKDYMSWLAHIPEANQRLGKSLQEGVQIQRHWTGEALGDPDLDQLFSKGMEGVTAALDEAAQRVHPITNELEAAAEKFDDSITNFNQTWSNFKTDVGPMFLGPLSAALDKLDEGLNLASKYPADAAAAAATIAGSLAALYARRRIMSSMGSGGGLALNRAAGELSGAAGVQKSAAQTFAEAVAEFRAGVREMAGKGGGGGGDAGGGLPEEERKKPGGRLRLGPGTMLRGGAIAAQLANINHEFDDVPQMSLEDAVNNVIGPAFVDRLKYLGGQALSAMLPEARTKDDAYTPPVPFHPADDDRLTRSGRLGWSSYAPNTDGNALHQHDDDLSPLFRMTTQELFAQVRQGSKEGIVAGLREMAQEQALSSGTGGPGIGADGGAPNLRFGRGASGGYRSTPGSQGGAPLGKGAVGGTFRGGRSPQAALAKEAYDFWRSKGLDHNAALSMVAQEQGESSFDVNSRGDGGSAHGLFQWHADRRAAILKATGINVDNADHRQQLEAAWYEGTKGMRAGFFQSLNGRTLQDAVFQGVHRFEGSKHQMADTARRLGMARAWDGGGSFMPPPVAPPRGAAPQASTGPQGVYPNWMDPKSRREMAGINGPLARDLLAASQETGLHFRVLQGLRTPEEAALFARQGRGAKNSQHIWGAAADIKLTDALGHDLNRMDPAYERFANAYEAHSRATGGQGRWLGHSRGWSWDRAHFDQGLNYGQTHARDPYGQGGPTKDDVNSGNQEIFRGPDNPFTRAAKPLGEAAEKLKAAVAPLPPAAPEPRRPPDADAPSRRSDDPANVHVHLHQDGRFRTARVQNSPGVQVTLRRGQTMVRTA